MLPKKSRIHKADFKSFGRPTIFHSSFLSLAIYKGQVPLSRQFSFVCSKKVAKNAATRNLLRRRGYASVKEVVSKVVRGYYYVFSFKQGAPKASFAEIRESVYKLLKDAKVV